MAKEKKPAGVALGKVIRERRLVLGFSQEEYAARVGDGLTQSDVSLIERGGVGRPRALRMARLADALGWTAQELMERAGWIRGGDGRETSELLRASGIELARIELMQLVSEVNAEDVRTLLMVARRMPSGRKRASSRDAPAAENPPGSP